MGGRSWIRVAPVVAAIGWIACSFEPNLTDGTIACAQDRSCPPGFICAADSKCYRPGLGPAFDAGPPIPTGPAKASLSTTGIDFGNVACGTTPTTSKVVTISNLGGEPLTWSASLSATPDFSISDPSSGTIAGGGTANVTILAPVAAVSGAGETAQAVLTITTSDPAHASTELPIKRTAAGGTLTVTPLTVDFGEAPKSIPASDIPLEIKNVGNQTVTVGFGTITSPGFTITCAGSPCPAASPLAPNAMLAGVVAHFTPADVGTFSATAPLVIGGATCGTNPSLLTFAGTGVSGFASVSPGSLDFGLVDCGKSGAAKTFQIRNSGNSAFNWKVPTLPSNYTLSTAAGAVAANTNISLAANTTVMVTVTPKAIPATSAVTTNGYGEPLTITTDSPNDNPHTVNLIMTARGAILAQSTNSVSFGSVLISAPAAKQTFTVSNNGNAPATVSYASSDAVFGVTPQNNTVTAGSSYTATASFDPAAAIDYNATATMSVLATDVRCAPLPPAIALSGRGALSASVTPGDVDFGLVDCGKTGAQKTVTIANTGSANFSWSAALGKGGASYFTINPTSGNNLQPTKSATITITPKAIPSTSATTPDLYGDTLTITTNPTLESPYTATLHMTAHGAILTFEPTSVSFTPPPPISQGGSKSKPFTIVNAGNENAPFTLNKSGGSQFALDVTTGTVAAGTSFSNQVTFTRPNGDNGQTYTGSVSLSTTAVKCAPTPNGTAGGGGLTLSASGY